METAKIKDKKAGKVAAGETVLAKSKQLGANTSPEYKMTTAEATTPEPTEKTTTTTTTTTTTMKKKMSSSSSDDIATATATASVTNSNAVDSASAIITKTDAVASVVASKAAASGAVSSSSVSSGNNCHDKNIVVNKSSPSRSGSESTSAPTPAALGGGGGGDPRSHLSEKKLRRLEKNRLSARECRRRKREAAQQLEREINVLESENLKLRLQLQIGEEAEESHKKEQEKLADNIHALLQSGASESEVHNQIEEFKEKFADHGRNRRSAMEFHLRNVERLLMPTTTTSVAIRALRAGGGGVARNENSEKKRKGSSSSAATNGNLVANDYGMCGDDETKRKKPKVDYADATTELPLPPAAAASTPAIALSINSEVRDGSGTPSTTVHPRTEGVTSNKEISTDPKKMFQYLVEYLNVTPEQASALKDSRKVAQELDEALAKALSMLDEIRKRLTECGEELEMEFATMRAILSPSQCAKFLVWIMNNGACMHMLNELWSKIHYGGDHGSVAATGNAS